MKSIEHINQEKNPIEVEGGLDAIVNWEIMENFVRTFEELGAFGDLEIPEKPSPKIREKLKAVGDFLKRNNYENAKVLAFGMVVVLGKSALDLLLWAKRWEAFGVPVDDFKSLVELVSVYASSDGLRENLFAGAGSSVIQKAVLEIEKTWQNNGQKIKLGLKKVIESSLEILKHEPTKTQQRGISP